METPETGESTIDFVAPSTNGSGHGAEWQSWHTVCFEVPIVPITPGPSLYILNTPEIQSPTTIEVQGPEFQWPTPTPTPTRTLLAANSAVEVFMAIVLNLFSIWAITWLAYLLVRELLGNFFVAPRP